MPSLHKPAGRGLARVTLALLLAALPLASRSGESDGYLLPDVGPDAASLLSEVILRLPTQPITLRGRMVVRRQRGVVLSTHHFSVALDWSTGQPRSAYHLLDGFGRTIRGVAIRLSAEGSTLLEWDPAPSADTPAPTPAELIADSDVAWDDLALAFLWWPRRELAGSAKFRGADCHLVDVISPAPTPDCHSMRLWIDQKLLLLRQIEQYGADGELCRRMWVSSVGKIGDQWMIRNMEVERPGTGIRTKIEVEELAPTL